VVEQGSERGEALTTTLAVLVGTVVKRGLVSRAADVLLKGSGSDELAVTDVALIAGTVVSVVGVPGRVDGVAVVPFEQTFSDDSVGITLTENTMDDAAGEVLGLGAGRGLKMMRDAAGSDEGSLAEWTRDGGALVDTASHVLSQVVGVLEVAVAVRAVEMLVVSFIVLVIITSLLRAKGKVTSLAVVGVRPVVLGSHVVIGGSLGSETHVASITFVRPLPVIQSIHVLGTSLPGVEAASAGITLEAAHGVLEFEIERVDVTGLGNVSVEAV